MEEIAWCPYCKTEYSIYYDDYGCIVAQADCFCVKTCKEKERLVNKVKPLDRAFKIIGDSYARLNQGTHQVSEVSTEYCKEQGKPTLQESLC